MSHVIIDRRKNDKGKSSVNRRKFIDRVKGILKDGVKDIVRDGGLKDLAAGKGKKIKIPGRSLEEPNFQHDGETGVHDRVLPGNNQHKKGDKIKRPEQGGGSGRGNQGSPDGDGEDGFSFTLTKEEFLDLFFENCALPDLVKQNMAVTTEEQMQRTGFSTEGSPAQMNVMRSMRGAKSRRFGLRAMKTKKLKVLEAERDDLIREIGKRKNASLDTMIEEDALRRLELEIEALKRRIKAVPFLDPIDLRFNAWSKVKTPKCQAAMVCLMDVSGSMDEEKKELAKTFYLLLYLFLDQEYDSIEIEYITYHSRAQVVDEKTFYYGTETGGTVTSYGVQLAYDTIMEKYNPSLWNVYLAHSSDGDNFASDNVAVLDIVENKLLPILQYYAYVQINPHGDSESATKESAHGLWTLYSKLSDTHKNVSSALITTHEEVYPVFIKLFERKK